MSRDGLVSLKMVLKDVYHEWSAVTRDAAGTGAVRLHQMGSVLSELCTYIYKCMTCKVYRFYQVFNILLYKVLLIYLASIVDSAVRHTVHRYDESGTWSIS